MLLPMLQDNPFYLSLSGAGAAAGKDAKQRAAKKK
jgi:hypothetical protein